MISIKHALAAIPLSLALLASSAVGVANAQVYTTTTTGYPILGVQLLTTGLTQNAGAGSQNAVMAVLRLDTTYSNQDIRLSSIPLVLTTGGNATGASLGSCQWVNTANPNTNLNTGANVMSGIASGANNFTLDTPLVLPRGTVTTLNLQCDIASNAASGGTFTFSMNTANVAATGVTTGQPAVVAVGTGLGAGTGTGTIPGGTTYPGLPNTGAGGDAARNISLILGSLVLAGLGLSYSRRHAGAR